jgi:hypothetical protein
MTENLAFDPESLFQQVVERGRESGVAEQEAYDELVDDFVQEHVQVGEFDEDNDLPDLTEQLKTRWPDYKAALGLDTEQPQL